MPDAYNGKVISRSKQQVGRKNALVALANLSDAFNRMLSEPKRQQKATEVLHQFVVLNHMLTSYIATCRTTCRMETLPYTSEELLKGVQKTYNNILQMQLSS